VAAICEYRALAKLKEKIMRHNFALALPVIAALLATASSAQAQTLDAGTSTAEDAFAAALGCTATRAKGVALNAVGGGRVIFVEFNRQDRPPHWDVFIISGNYEHVVWVNVACTVIGVLTQSL
jgi:hypothetical protein